MTISKFIPSFDNIENWAKEGITQEFLFNTLDAGIHPIHWVKEEILKQLYDDYLLRECYSTDKKYYKINYGNVVFRDFQLYPFLYFCRGDVLTVDSDLIVYKAPNKFWNIGENELVTKDKINWRNVKIYEKMDGIMILPYRRSDGAWELSSRGSFEYETIKIAEEYFNDNYKEFCNILLEYNMFPCFELVSRESFIKVEYDKKDYGLYYLGAVFMDGIYCSRGWHRDKAKELEILIPKEYKNFKNFDEVYKFVNGFDSFYSYEGVVINTVDGMVKLKSDKYCEMNIQKLDNVKKVYDLWIENQLDDILPHISPEKADEVLKLISRFKAIKQSLNDEYEKLAPVFEKMNDIKDVVEYINLNCDKRFFHFYINKYKENIRGVETSRKNLILREVEENE